MDTKSISNQMEQVRREMATIDRNMETEKRSLDGYERQIQAIQRSAEPHRRRISELERKKRNSIFFDKLEEGSYLGLNFFSNETTGNHSGIRSFWRPRADSNR